MAFTAEERTRLAAIEAKLDTLARQIEQTPVHVRETLTLVRDIASDVHILIAFEGWK